MGNCPWLCSIATNQLEERRTFFLHPLPQTQESSVANTKFSRKKTRHTKQSQQKKKDPHNDKTFHTITASKYDMNWYDHFFWETTVLHSSTTLFCQKVSSVCVDSVDFCSSFLSKKAKSQRLFRKIALSKKPTLGPPSGFHVIFQSLYSLMNLPALHGEISQPWINSSTGMIKLTSKNAINWCSTGNWCSGKST